jgi:hypothetical protein
MKLNQLTLSNIKGYIQGNLRKFLEDYPGVIGDHVYEQVQWRLGIMNEECLIKKECPCECTCPQKQYEDRACEKNCYPDMMEEEDWELFKEKNEITKSLIVNNLYKRKDLIW